MWEASNFRIGLVFTRESLLSLGALETSDPEAFQFLVDIRPSRRRIHRKGPAASQRPQ